MRIAEAINHMTVSPKFIGKCNGSCNEYTIVFIAVVYSLPYKDASSAALSAFLTGALQCVAIATFNVRSTSAQLTYSSRTPLATS
jgi:hypothetical protein